MPAAGALDSGRYEIGRLLGRGGLGEVYLAYDRTLGRDVAIKYVSPDKVADASARRALLREARAAAALDHPYICTVYETGETPDGRGYIVMQYVEGETLSTVLQQGAMSVRDALSLCADIADALGAAHRRGVIHRDLKPGNIIVTPSGRPKLVDFGIAKVTLERALPADESTLTGGTLDDVLVGTPAYMSPEQVQKLPLDGRSDLFALGLVLFECLTGRRAFKAPTALATFANILQVHPPPPSTMRVGLSDAHDELCRRLLAKDPADRFQSAEEVVGALRVLLPDTSRTRATDIPWLGSPPRRWNRRVAIASAVVLVVAAIAGGAAVWNRGSGLPPVPEASDVWYRRGSDALREGGYHTARKAFQQAIEIFPQHALAYARLAEADAELDDPQAAQASLLRVSSIVPDESRLATPERLRLGAVRAGVLRDVDRSIALYRELTTINDADAGSYVDLGRAQEAAGMRNDARASYEEAIERDKQYAAAYLRLGRVEALESRQKEALAAFAEAERWYKTSSSTEGQAEVALARGSALDGFNDLAAAKRDIEVALDLATAADSTYQQVRAKLALSSVTASEGRFTEAQAIASAAVREAEAKGLHAIAAGGLVDLAAALLFAGQRDEAERSLERAIRLAGDRGAKFTVTRAKVQLAEVKRRNKETARAARALIDEVLPFVRENRYRRLELQAQLIAARVHESLDELDRGREIATQVLQIAELVNDDGQWASTASTLASISTSLGRYPEALRLRDRAAEIHRRQGDKASLPYDLTNRADLLIRLNRRQEADAMLTEVEQGIAAGHESFKTRMRRVLFLRAFDAVTTLRCADALPRLTELARDTTANDMGTSLGPAMRTFCDAAGKTAPPGRAEPEAAEARERQYWYAAAALRRRDMPRALADAVKGLDMLGTKSNDELRWRLATVAAVAARHRGDPKAETFTRTAADAYERLRVSYQNDFVTYQQRPDLVDLKKEQT